MTALPWIECISLYLLVRWLNGGGLWHLVATGVATGAGVYVYKGFSIFAAALLLFWVFLFVSRRASLGRGIAGGGSTSSPRTETTGHPVRTEATVRPVRNSGLLVGEPVEGHFRGNDDGTDSSKRLLRGAMVFAVVAFVAAIPFMYTLSTSSSQVLLYRDLSSPFSLPAFQDAPGLADKALFVLRRFYIGASVYGAGRQLDWTDGLGTRGLLDPLTLGLFVIGVLAALWAWRDWRLFLLLAGLVTGILATAYLSVPHWGENRRGISALPMVFALAGLGGHVLIAFGERSLRRRWLYAAAGLLIAIVAALNLGYYFGDLTRSETTRIVFVEHLTRATDYVKSLPGEPPYVYLLSANWSWEYETRRFLLPDVAGEDRSAQFGAYDLTRAEARPQALFILMGPYEDKLDELRTLYPGGKYHEEREGGQFLFGAYLVGQTGS